MGLTILQASATSDGLSIKVFRAHGGHASVVTQEAAKGVPIGMVSNAFNIGHGSNYTCLCSSTCSLFVKKRRKNTIKN